MLAFRLAAAAALLLIIASAALEAQSFVAPPDRPSPDSASFTKLTRSFEDWARSHDLSKTRGWKWFKRWADAQEQRLNPDGEPAGAAAFVEAAQQMSRQRSTFLKDEFASGWYPVGPSRPEDYNFTQMNPGLGRINCIAFHPTDSMIMWVGVAQGGVWKTVDGGTNWRPLTDQLPILRISDIAVDPSDPDVMYISVGDFAYVGVDLKHVGRKRHTHYGLGVYKTTDGGGSWAPTGLSLQLDSGDASLIRRVLIDPRNTAHLLAAGAAGTWRSTDAGVTWRRERTDMIWDIERDPSDPDKLYAATGFLYFWSIGAASIIRSSDFGRTWSNMPANIPQFEVQRIELAVSRSDPRYVYALASGLDQTFHSFHRSTDGGTTWTEMAVRAQAPNILGGYNGSDQDTYGQGSYDLALIVDPRDPTRVYAGGINIWGSSDGGATWDAVSFWTSEVPNSVHADQHQFAYSGLNGRFYVCNDGGLYSTGSMEIGGFQGEDSLKWRTIWQRHADGMAITSFYRVGISRNNPGYAIGGAQDNGTFYYDGSRWSEIIGGDGMECFIDDDYPRTVFGSAQYGTLVYSRDGGQSVEGLATQPQQLGERGEWTTPFTQNAAQPRVLYAGFGNLWRNTGPLTSWRRLSNFPTVGSLQYPTPISAMAVDPLDTLVHYVAKRIWHSYGIPTQVLRTTDGGLGWTDITRGLPDSLYSTSLASLPDNPRTVWATFSGFVDGQKVYRSIDAGDTWENITRNLPNIPVNVVVCDPASSRHRIFVGTDIGVFTTADNLDRWIPCSDNLPNVIVSDLEIQPVSRTLYAATFGRGLWALDLESLGGAKGSSEPAGLSVRATVSDGSVILELTSAAAVRGATAEVIDVLGRVVRTSPLDIPAGISRARVADGLSEGLYFVRISQGMRATVVKCDG